MSYYITLMFRTPMFVFNQNFQFWGSINCYIACHGFYKNCFISFCYRAWTLARTVLWWILCVNYLSTQLWPWMCLIRRWCFEIWLPRLILWICCTALISGPTFISKVNTHIRKSTLFKCQTCVSVLPARPWLFLLPTFFSWNYNFL